MTARTAGCLRNVVTRSPTTVRAPGELEAAFPHLVEEAATAQGAAPVADHDGGVRRDQPGLVVVVQPLRLEAPAIGCAAAHRAHADEVCRS